MFKRLKCALKGHDFEKPRLRLGKVGPIVEQTVTCKRCGTAKKLEHEEHLRLTFLAIDYYGKNGVSGLEDRIQTARMKLRAKINNQKRQRGEL